MLNNCTVKNLFGVILSTEMCTKIKQLLNELIIVHFYGYIYLCMAEMFHVFEEFNTFYFNV